MTFLFAAPFPPEPRNIFGEATGSDRIYYLPAPMPSSDPLDFVRPLLAAGMDPLDACVLYHACDKDLNAALALLALSRLVGEDPQTLLRDKKWRKAALRVLGERLADAGAP